MSRYTPGIKQRQVLNVIAQHGGVYPPHWKPNYDERQLLERMVERGLLVKSRHPLSGQPVYRLPT